MAWNRNLLGGFDTAHAAARSENWELLPLMDLYLPAQTKKKNLSSFNCFRAYDRAAIKFRGVDADINFNLSDYDEDLRQVSFTSPL